MLEDVLPAAIAAGAVAILVTVLIERYGGVVGGALGTVPTTIVPAVAGMASAQGDAELMESLSVVPAGMLVNAIFLSVVINVVNYGMEKDEETGMLKMPEGGFAAVLDNTKRGMVEYMMAVPKQFKEIYEGSNPALESAIEELEDAKMAAYAARGTDAAEATAMRFMEKRRKCVDLGLSPTSELLNPGLPSNTE